MPKSDYIFVEPTASNQVVGGTPYGIYDSDSDFQSDSINVVKWVARRLGHPVMQLEFNSGSIYATYEEAVSEYSLHINNYNIRNWMWESYGAQATGSGFSTTGSDTNKVVTPHMGTTFMLSKQYGQAALVGGDNTLYTGSISLTSSVQTYDLQTQANVEGGHLSKRMEIQTVFNNGPAAITKFYDPFAGSYDQRNMLDSFGMGNVSPAVSFILRPVSYDIARSQAIETNDRVRKSNYSFELINNKMRIFPIPNDDDNGNKIYFHYYLREDVGSVKKSSTDGLVSDPSNIPYKFITYSEINSNGRQWIRKYTLALAKELLGIIRSKYSSMPLPNGEVTMDGEALKAEGREEKQLLLDELKEFLESVSLTNRAREEQEQSEANQAVLNKAPLGIYLG